MGCSTPFASAVTCLVSFVVDAAIGCKGSQRRNAVWGGCCAAALFVNKSSVGLGNGMWHDVDLFSV